MMDKPGIFGKYRFLIAAFIIFVLSLFVKLSYFNSLQKVLMFPDSYEYLSAAEKIKSLNVEISRVPGYPVFLLATRVVFRFMKTETGIFIAQAIMSSVGAVLLLKAGFLLFKSRIASVSVCLIYIFHSAVFSWDFLILTESMSMFLIILLVLLFALYSYTRHRMYLLFLYMTCIVLMFTKPFYIFLPVLLSGVLIFQSMVAKDTKDIKRVLALSIIGPAVAYSIVAAYSYVNYRQNGYFGISNVSAINRLGKVLQYDMYSLGENEKIVSLIENEMKTNGGAKPVPAEFIKKHGLDDNNYSELREFLNSIIKKHPLLFVKKTVELTFTEIYKEKFFIDYNKYNSNSEWHQFLYDKIADVPWLNSFGFVFILLLAEISNIVFSIAKSCCFRVKKHEWPWIFVMLLCLYQLVLSIAGSHGEYHRLMAPVYALIFLIFMRLILQLCSFGKKVFCQIHYKEKN